MSAGVAKERAEVRAKMKRMHAELHKLHDELKKLRKDLHYANVAIRARDEQISFFVARLRPTGEERAA